VHKINCELVILGGILGGIIVVEP